MKDHNVARWLGAIIALLVFMIPVLLTDVLSLMASWMLILFLWLLIIGIGVLETSLTTSADEDYKGH
ncbi:MAG: hypothetical protein HRU23_15235 [Gammaproteobacteria bacterium]|nr:hypothetical protein [Gammaproteobacteria bacterium]